MTITIEFHGQLRQLTQTASIVLDTPDGTDVSTVLKTLHDEYNDTFRSILFNDAGEVSTTTLILLNDEPVERATWPTLSDSDVITILPPIAGG